MRSACIIFPHQLFRNHPCLEDGVKIFLVEEFLFFRQYRFHRQKLILHRASMKFYEHWLRAQGHTVTYIDAQAAESDCRQLVAQLAAEGAREICIAEVADDWLRRRMKAACRRNGVQLRIERTPNFLNDDQEAAGFFDDKKRYFQTEFYIWQRQMRGVLLDPIGGPLGGQWSFDSDNRRRLPPGEPLPAITPGPDNVFLQEARKYVAQYFVDAYGQDSDKHLFVVTFEDADRWLDEFLIHRLAKFGPYEDAIVAEQSVLFHSVLTPMLNIGLLDPPTIIRRAMTVAPQQAIPLQSLEGFLRQIMGWREFIHIVYQREGGRQRTRNFWGFTRKIPTDFWTGSTGIEPVDKTIKKILRWGYCHHIERLMVLGNFMLLCEFDPDEVYLWFMELFVDAYDWVMVPNVYGMTQFADGGLMITKPYISGSNYLLKMGNFKKGSWQDTWDALFWRFMHVHRDFFGSNPRLGMLLNTFDKMSADKRGQYLSVAETFLRQLDLSR
jgi:deoxyribodipyrimidine photolyase-related protein